MTLAIDPFAVARKAIELADANPDFIYEKPQLVADGEAIFELADGSLVDDEGDYVDPDSGDCQYVSKGAASCLFGQAAVGAGVSIGDLANHEGNAISALLFEDADSNNDRWDSNTLMGAMDTSQRRQDEQQPWGMSIEPLKAYFAKRELAVVAA